MSVIIGNRYLLKNKLGVGGMGEVYEAYDRLSTQMVALKRVSIASNYFRNTTPEQEHQQRLSLTREFQTLAALRHPNIISVLDYGFDEDHRPYFTMTLLEDAKPLREAVAGLDDRGKIQPIIQVLQALTYLHRRGILHCDLKPGNVLVTPNGQVKLLDFGLATEIHRAKEMTGTLEYMAPELLQNGEVSRASDLYAVGVMLYEILAQRHPFNTASIDLLMQDILSCEPDMSRLHAAELIEFTVERLLNKSPETRYQDASLVIHDLCLALDIPVPEEPSAIRESFLQAARFVGRDTELTQLRAALEAARRKEGTAWLIGGESGVGKSRLLNELRTYALVDGMLVLHGQALESGSFSYQIWRDLVRRLLINTPIDTLQASILKEIIPDIGDVIGRDVPMPPQLSGPASAERLSLNILELFRIQQQPILLLLEDLQWTEESLEILKTFVQFMENLSICIVASYRNDERPDLPRHLSEMRQIVLQRLSEVDVEELCTSMIGKTSSHRDVLELVRRESEGNTFFVVEIVRALAEEAGGLEYIGNRTLPSTVFTGGLVQLVRRRLNRVPQWGRELLELAAVAGRYLDLKVISQFHLPDPHYLDEWLTVCEGCAVLNVYDNQWRFTHDKLREGVLADLSPQRRLDLHRQIALAIEDIYGDAPSQAETLLRHWQEAKDVAKEIAYILPVTQRLVINSGEYDRAMQFIKRALEIIPANDPRHVIALNYQSEILLRRSDYEAARINAKQALALAEHHHDQKSKADSLLDLGRIATEQGDYPQALDYLTQSLNIATMINYPYVKAMCLNSLGIITGRLGNYVQAREYYVQALEIRQAIGHLSGVASSLNNLGALSNYVGDFDMAWQYLTQSLEVSQALGHKFGISQALHGLGNTATFRGDYITARLYYAQSIEASRTVGNLRGISNTLYALGNVSFYQGKLTDAQQHLEDSLVMRRSMHMARGIAECQIRLSIIMMLEGDFMRARQLLNEVVGMLDQIAAIPVSLEMVAAMGRWFMLWGNEPLAVMYFGLILAHPKAEQELKIETRYLLSILALPPEDTQNLLHEGGQLPLATALERIQEFLSEDY